MLLLILEGEVMADKSKPWSKKDPLVFSLIVAICILVLCFIVTGFTDKGGVFARFLGTIDKKTTIESIAFIMSGVIASIVAVAIYRRAEAQAASAEAQAASAEAQAASAKAQAESAKAQAESAKAQAESAKAQTANNELIAKRHIYERAQYAIGNLGNALPRPRILSFYQLFYLALESQDKDNDFKQSILDMLCVYLRDMTIDESYKGKKHPTRECQILLNIVFRSGYPQVFGELRANVQKCHFVGAEFMSAKPPKNTSFRHTNLKQTNFTRADMAGIWFHNADLSDANLSNADLSDADLSDAKLLNANLSDADLSDADLSNANLSNAKLLGAKLWDTDLSDADLSNANLWDANLWDANLSDANLSGTNLSGTNLKGANLKGTQLKNANLMEVRSIEKANFYKAKIGDRSITKDDIPTDKGEYYADWNPPPEEEEN